jgi:hypothetical protein
VAKKLSNEEAAARLAKPSKKPEPKKLSTDTRKDLAGLTDGLSRKKAS